MSRSYGYIHYPTLIKTPLLLIRMMRNQWLSPEALRELRNKRLRTLIEHSYENVPYYRSLLKRAKLTPFDIRTMDDLPKIPISTKEAIRNLPITEIMDKHADLGKCKIRKTSGTTGRPVSIPWNTQMRLMHMLTHIRFMAACGNKLTDRIVQVGPRWLPTNERLQRLGMYITEILLPSQPLEKQIQKLMKLKPDALVGYPSHILALAAEIKEKGMEEVRPKRIFTGGEILYPYGRELNKEVFGAETYDHYGCNEAGLVSYECSRREGHHVCSDMIIVEITKNGETLPAGEKGEITITNLCNYVGPLIRYNLEDIGVLVDEKCSCGRSFELMRITEGRKGNVIKLRDGRCFSAIELTEALLPLSGLKQFQIVQKEEDEYLMRVVKAVGFTGETVDKIRGVLRDKLGPVKIMVEILNEIPMEKSGKVESFIGKNIQSFEEIANKTE